MTTAAPGRGVAGGELTGEQEEAIERRRGALLLAANAGSGKTTVLVERFVRAVHEDGVAPSRILAITFTERAAGELRERVRRRLHELGDRGAARETEAAFVSTIHGFCARLLRSHPLAGGLAPGFGVLDEGTAAGLRAEAFELALSGWLTGGGALDLAAAVGVDRLAEAIGAIHDELRSRGSTRPRLPPGRPRHDPAAARTALVAARAALARELDAIDSDGLQIRAALDQLQRDPDRVAACDLKLPRGARALRGPAGLAYEEARLRCCEAQDDAEGVVALDLLGALLDGFAGEYARLKQGRGALDFDDLELCARDLLSGDEELRRRWSERFELLMVDELQDTNSREMAILAALDRGNLFTVGDEFQSIYGFRHADVGIFRRRRRELADVDGVRVLPCNFRSRPPIIGAVNATFGPLFGPDFVPLAAGREDGPCGEPLVELMLNDTAGWEDTAVGDAPGSGPAWRRAEAGLLAQRIAALIEAGEARPGEVVVLLRYATAAGVYEQALTELGVAVAAAPGGGFYAAQEVSDLGAYARVLANPLDDLALYGVLASPLCGLGSDGLAVVGLAAKALNRPPWEVISGVGEGDPTAVAALAGLGAGERERLEACRAQIAGERRVAPRLGPAELLARSGYRERALGGPGTAQAVANLRKLARLAREFELREGPDLRRFADRLAARRLGSSREQDAELAQTEAVRLMTIHAAKGLEFPVVCLADLGHGPPIGGPIILTDGERVGLRLSTLETRRIEAFAYPELRERRNAAALAEEQRIAYVAMTRARERLILSGAAHFARWPAAGPAAAAVAWLGPAMVNDLPARLAGRLGVSELELGGARLRLTLTAAPDPATAAPGPRTAPPAGGLGAGLDAPVAAQPAAARGAQPPAQTSLFGPGPGGWSPHEDSAEGPRQGAEPVLVGQSWRPAANEAVTPPSTSLSYSGLADYARCGYGYYLRRVIGLAAVAPPPGLEPSPRVGGGLDASARGRIVHALLERLDFARPAAPTAALVRARSEGLELDAEELETIRGLVGAFGGSPLCARLARAGRVSREGSFALTVGELMVGGYVDVLADEAPGAVLVVDYKTDRVDPDTDLAARVSADYQVQRQIYALAALRAGAESVEVAYCFLRRPQDVVSVCYAATQADMLERRLAALAAPLLAGRFEVAAEPHRGLCATCPGRARLCSWSSETTLREQVAVQVG